MGLLGTHSRKEVTVVSLWGILLVRAEGLCGKQKASRKKPLRCDKGSPAAATGWDNPQVRGSQAAGLHLLVLPLTSYTSHLA